MPIYITPQKVKMRQLSGNNSDQFYGLDVVAAETTAEHVAAINNAADNAILNVDSAAYAAAAEAADLEARVNEIQQAIQSVQQTNTDTTLTLSGAPADAKAVGDLKSALLFDLPLGRNKVNLTWNKGWINNQGVYNSSDNRFVCNALPTDDLLTFENKTGAVVYVLYFSSYTDLTNFTFVTYYAINNNGNHIVAKGYPYVAFECDSTNSSVLNGSYLYKNSPIDYLSTKSINAIKQGITTNELTNQYGYTAIPTEMRNDVVYRISQSGAETSSNLWWSTKNYIPIDKYDAVVVLKKPDSVPQSMYILYYDDQYKYITAGGPAESVAGTVYGINKTHGASYIKVEFGGNKKATEDELYNCVLCVSNLKDVDKTVDHYRKVDCDSLILHRDGHLYFESGSDDSVYWHFDSIVFFRGAYPTRSILFDSNIQSTDAPIYLDQVFTLVTSPHGHANCLKIPHNHALVYDYDENTVVIKSILNADDLKSDFIILKASLGRVVGGALLPFYIGYRADPDNNLPYYWRAYLDSKINDVKQLIEGSDESFIFITDVHTPNNRMYSPDLIKYIRKKISIPYVIVGGDYGNAASTKRLYLDQVDAWMEKADKDWIMIRGNHDNNYQGTGEVTAADFYVRAIRPLKNEVTPKSYLENVFYIDDENAKFRFIFLDTIYEGTADISDQVTWMQAKINELTSDWSVIVFSHMCFAPARVSSGVTELNLTNLGTQIKDGIHAIYDTCAANIVAYIVGHVHRDYSATTQKGYPIISTTCDTRGAQVSEWDINYPESTINTTNEQAFDVFGINKTNRTITAIRIGRGAASRTFSY